MEEKRYAFASQQAIDDGYATAWWTTPHGTEIEVCAVYNDQEGAEYKWPDKQYVGEVVKFARAGRPDSHTGIFLRGMWVRIPPVSRDKRRAIR
jgi:hypothetical protein